MTAEDIAKSAYNNFRKLAGGTISTKKQPLTYPVSVGNSEYVELRMGQQKAGFHVDIKHEIRNMHILSLLERYGRNRKDHLLVCQYIPMPIKMELKEKGINYLEASGNCYIQTDNFFFYINDQKVTEVRKKNKGKIWNTTGLKFLFVVLAEPTLLNSPYRDTAKCAGISISNIKGYIDELIAEGYVENEGGKLFFVQKGKLLEQWINQYELHLAPKLFIGNYSFREKEDNFNEADQRLAHYYSSDNKQGRNGEIILGGEAAANYWTRRLRPEKFSVYTDASSHEVERVLRLKPDANGEIKLMRMFWTEGLNHEANKNRLDEPKKYLAFYTHPLLAYTELMTSTDSRNREIATMIKERYHLYE